ncbi:PP2C family protein-serine/threonine phosphatase [Pontibacillus marinus]|uniref:Protein serine/threonine phosphatase n=1 Tax=Pontibacillus marinus BH030004 = DSM 16465 TaxID=1385511 RepID=A0A0A5GEZ0_9BACI|nr:PP2C family protein-serine/threonine phosphatase [Pontibacillus marinus]KGX91791.1 protein serine/threonine phosphatase [Pontibacillus marinus BH030004 = DSM 16465]
MFRREMLFETKTDYANKTLEREIKLARNIQMELLNGSQPTLEKGQVTGYSLPARLIGGDYYDFHVLPNGKLRIIIGDVMGKGIPAAMLMILTRGAFRSAAESTQGPSETLTAMNKALYSDLRTLNSFVTVLCADWNPETNVLSYASAGHNLPLVVKSNQDIEEVPKVKGVMLGGLPQNTYKENFVQLLDEQLVFFYTDGITEAQNSDGDMFQTERLRKVLQQNYAEAVEDIENSVIESLDNFTENVQQKDDITMVLLKVHQGQTKVSSYNSPVLN